MESSKQSINQSQTGENTAVMQADDTIQSQLKDFDEYLDKVRNISNEWWENRRAATLDKAGKKIEEHRMLRENKEFKDFSFQFPTMFRSILRERPSERMLEEHRRIREVHIRENMDRETGLRNFADPTARRYLKKYLKPGVNPINENTGEKI